MPKPRKLYKAALTICVGYEGPTDSCLVLKSQNAAKEFLIESFSWRVLEAVVGQNSLPYAVAPSDVMYRGLFDLLYEKDTAADERIEAQPSDNIKPKDNAASTSTLLNALFELYVSSPSTLGAWAHKNSRYETAKQKAHDALDSWGLIGE